MKSKLSQQAITDHDSEIQIHRSTWSKFQTWQWNNHNYFPRHIRMCVITSGRGLAQALKAVVSSFFPCFLVLCAAPAVCQLGFIPVKHPQLHAAPLLLRSSSAPSGRQLCPSSPTKAQTNLSITPGFEHRASWGQTHTKNPEKLNKTEQQSREECGTSFCLTRTTR